MIKFRHIWALAILLAFAKTGTAAEGMRMLRYPDINQNLIAFTFAGDIWTVDAQGGEAKRLTSHLGLEIFPKISPDGQWIAFSAEYSGSRQVYVIPAKGGTPRQLTYYNDVGPMPPRGGFDYITLDWTPDSKNILVRANRTPWGERMGKYYLVSLDGGLETPLQIPEGGLGVLSPDGNKVCYAAIGREFRTWKRYKGGRASDLWIYDLQADQSEKITDFLGTDQIPTWHGDKIYFASDRDLTLNIYSYDINSKETKQLTTHSEFDVMWPSGSNGQLAYEVGGQIYKLDVESGQEEKVSVQIHFDNPNTLPYIKNVSKHIHSYQISPSGKRALFGARGDIYSVPAKEGITQNLTQTQGVREIYPSWSPDGKYIAYISDASGEYEIYILENKKGAKPMQITSNSNSWKYEPRWSPDSKKLVFFDRSLQLKMVDIASKAETVVAKAMMDEIRNYSFSPDSRWITYTQQSRNNQYSIWVYDTKNKSEHQLTSDEFMDVAPVFSTDGEYLFFMSLRDFNLQFSSFEFNYLYTNAMRPYAIVLQKNGERLFQKDNDVEESKEPSVALDEISVSPKKKKGKKEDSEEKAEESTKAVLIDFDGIENRIQAFPLEAGNYSSIYAIDGGIVYGKDNSLYKYDLKKKKSDQIIANVSRTEISADGKKMLFRSNGDYVITDVAAGQTASSGKLNLGHMDMKIDPLKEWEQIYTDGWRIFRDYFYVKNMHGVDWEGLKNKYAQLLPHVGHRADLDYIFGEIIAESNTGHAYANYGDFAKPKRIESGLLGAVLQADPAIGRYKIAKIYEGENWNALRRSPLTEQGIDIKEGEYLISIDGHEVSLADNPYKYLENTIGKRVEIEVSKTGQKAQARAYTIEPIKSEGELRYFDWVNSRRKLVDSLSGGRIGYIHVPNTAFEGNRELHRGMYAFHNKEALIIDDRYNGGGFIPDIMADMLDRKTLVYWARRDLIPQGSPTVAHDGPKAMLINGYSSSGGDAFPYMFREKGLGKLIGTRTWGGLVGISQNASLVDGGYIAVPRFGIFDREDGWIIEGVGVSPDIEVVDEPHLVVQGQDPSIERAVEELLKELGTEPAEKVVSPAGPDRSGWVELEIE